MILHFENYQQMKHFHMSHVAHATVQYLTDEYEDAYHAAMWYSLSY